MCLSKFLWMGSSHTKHIHRIHPSSTYHVSGLSGGTITHHKGWVKSEVLRHSQHDHDHVYLQFGGNEVSLFNKSVKLKDPNYYLIARKLHSKVTTPLNEADPCNILQWYSTSKQQLIPFVHRFCEEILLLGKSLKLHYVTLILPGPRMLRNSKENIPFNIACYFLSYYIKQNYKNIFPVNTSIIDPFLNEWRMDLSCTHTAYQIHNHREVNESLAGISKYGATHYNRHIYSRIHDMVNSHMASCDALHYHKPPPLVTSTSQPQLPNEPVNLTVSTENQLNLKSDSTSQPSESQLQTVIQPVIKPKECDTDLPSVKSTDNCLVHKPNKCDISLRTSIPGPPIRNYTNTTNNFTVSKINKNLTNKTILDIDSSMGQESNIPLPKQFSIVENLEGSNSFLDPYFFEKNKSEFSPKALRSPDYRNLSCMPIFSLHPSRDNFYDKVVHSLSHNIPLYCTPPPTTTTNSTHNNSLQATPVRITTSPPHLSEEFSLSTPHTLFRSPPTIHNHTSSSPPQLTEEFHSSTPKTLAHSLSNDINIICHSQISPRLPGGITPLSNVYTTPPPNLSPYYDNFHHSFFNITPSHLAQLKKDISYSATPPPKLTPQHKKPSCSTPKLTPQHKIPSCSSIIKSPSFHENSISLKSPMNVTISNSPPTLSPHLNENKKSNRGTIQQGHSLSVPPKLTPQPKNLRNDHISSLKKSEILCSPDQWTSLKPIFTHLKRQTPKIIKKQTHLAFLKHCLMHKVGPRGLNLQPNCLEVSEYPKLNSIWQSKLQQCNTSLLKLTIKALKLSINACRSLIENNLLALRNQARPENFETLFRAISRLASKTALQQFKTKKKKSEKFMKCSNLSLIHVHSDIFKVDIVPNHCPIATPKRKRSRRFRRTPTPPPIQTVVNLSSQTLTEDENKLLEKGLKFCPVPRKMDETNNIVDTNKFTRKMRLKEYFKDNESSNEIKENYGVVSQAIPTFFTPHPGRNAQLDEFCISVSNHVSSLPKSSPHNNLSKGECDALKNFSKNINQNIVIKPADKGGAVVIQDTSDYIQVCDSLLSNDNFYYQVPEDQTLIFKKELDKLLSDQFKNASLPPDLRKSDLITRFPTEGRFYTLPKIHKQERPPPGRPIVSASGTITEAASAFADHHLKPLVPQLPSFIQDTTHFLQKLEVIKKSTLPPGTLLITLDVSSLYTNIPHEEGLRASEHFLNKRKNTTIPTDFLIKLMEFVLTHNNFEFNGKHYVQKQGTAMGTKMAPSYACLFMGNLEDKFLSAAEQIPDIWIRYIDDIFVIWTHGQESWDIFFENLNAFHKTIKFVSTTSLTNISFLDVEVKLMNGKIETDLYTKPTDSHNYLPWGSCHPQSTKKGIPYSQALRLRRICSLQNDFHKRLGDLKVYLSFRGFPIRHIKEAFDRVKSLKRLDTLNYQENKNNDRVTFPITFHPNLSDLPKAVHEKYHNIILKNPKNIEIFKDPPMLTYRRPKNLRELITRATLPDKTSQPKGFSECSKHNCKIYPHEIINKNLTFQSTVTKKSFKITQSFHCESHSVVYLITCLAPNCGYQYVGETGRQFYVRMGEHLSSIRDRRDNPVGSHFSQTGHTENHFSVQILEQILDPSLVGAANRRLVREKFWINTLEPQINGKTR